jgi:hypothetical protein
LGAIDVERRQGSEFERALVTVITGFGKLERLLLYIEGPAGLHNIPILAHHIEMASLTSASKLERDCSRERRAI